MFRFGRERRLRELAVVLERALAGDLTVATRSTAPDALGSVERGVDQLIARFVTVTGTLQQGLDRMRDARLAAADSHKQMLDSAELTAGQAYDVGVLADQVSDSITVVATATEELNSTINEIARHAEVAAEIAASAADQGGSAAAVVRELSAALKRIEEVANAITTIADRTHLLALNAKIEAQRAGDAGRGFAVVAAEVNELAAQTARATDDVRAIVADIDASSEKAYRTIDEIGGTMTHIRESTASIASAVTQQAATTNEIGSVSATAAGGATGISSRVASVHERARAVAYAGAQTDAAKSEEFARLERAFARTIAGLRVGDFHADFDDDQATHVDQAARNREGTTTVGGVTTVLDYVIGTGRNEFSYTGSWLHGNGYESDAGGDAYSCVAGDRVEMRFAGRKLRFYGSADQQQGMAEVSVDDAEPELVDFYAPQRAAHTLLWESPDLGPGEHTFRLTVSPKKNPQSRYFWASVAKVEIVQ
jgi:methyl-accepting chemotaxis protein